MSSLDVGGKGPWDSLTRVTLTVVPLDLVSRSVAAGWVVRHARVESEERFGSRYDKRAQNAGRRAEH